MYVFCDCNIVREEEEDEGEEEMERRNFIRDLGRRRGKKIGG